MDSAPHYECGQWEFESLFGYFFNSKVYIMDKIEKLKQLEKFYQIANDWWFNEKYTEEEYVEQIGEYIDYEPHEIVAEMCELIKTL